MTPAQILRKLGHRLEVKPTCNGAHPCGPWCATLRGETTVALSWARYSQSEWKRHLGAPDHTGEALDDLFAALLAERGYMPRDAE